MGPKLKRKSRSHLTAGQAYLLKESVKKLLGPGLGQSPTDKNEKEIKSNFLREALSCRLLDSEWLS
jgi:hypothetical protein